MVFVVEHLTTHILPTNEATLPIPLPAVQAATMHEYKNHELTNIAEPRIF